MPYSLDIKQLRKDAGLTQSQLAYRLGMTQSQISKLENSNRIDTDLLVKIADALMITPNELMNYSREMPKPFEVENTGQALYQYLEKLKLYIDQNQSVLSSARQDTRINDLTQAIHQMQETANRIGRRPRVAIVGNFSSGKSAMINTMLGQNILEIALPATTSLCTYILHSSERPDYLKDDEVWIFSSKEDGSMWTDSLLSFQDETEQMCMMSGSKELLLRYGTRQNAPKNSRASAALIFSDAELLKSCALIDSPGLNEIESAMQNSMAITGLMQADIIMFLSSCTSCMSGYEASIIQFLISSQKQKYPQSDYLRTLYIVASRADLVSPEELDTKKMLDLECCEKTFLREMGIKKEDISSRYFYYSALQCELRKPFEDDLRMLLNKWPQRSQEILGSYLKKSVENMKETLAACQKELNEKNRLKKKFLFQLQEYQKKHEQLQFWQQKRWAQLDENLIRLAEESEKACLEEYQKLINPDEIARLLEERFHHGKKKQDLQNLYTYLFSQLNLRFQESAKYYIGQAGLLISRIMDDILSAYTAKAEELNFLEIYKNLNSIANTLKKNILPGQTISTALAVQPVGIGSVCAASTAGIFMPAIFNTGVLISGLLAGFKITSAGREKWIAGQVINMCNDNKVWEQCQKQLHIYWKEIRKYVLDLKEQITQMVQNQFEDLHRLSEENSDDKEQYQAQYMALEEFLNNVPMIPLD